MQIIFGGKGKQVEIKGGGRIWTIKNVSQLFLTKLFHGFPGSSFR